MKRAILNLLVDALALLAAGAVVGTGLIMAYRLPPGRAGHGLSMLGWSRHEWGDVHLILAWVVIGLVVLHLLLHLEWLVRTCVELGHRCGPLGRRWVLPVILILTTGALVAAPWLLPVQRNALGGEEAPRIPALSQPWWNPSSVTPGAKPGTGLVPAAPSLGGSP